MSWLHEFADALGKRAALGLVFSSFVVPARAATVFDNYTGNTSESFGASYVAGGFMPTGNFDFTGEAAFVQSREDTSQSFTLSLYCRRARLAWFEDERSFPSPRRDR